jgi:hypothetical protein
MLDRLDLLVWWLNIIGIGMGEAKHPREGRAKRGIRMRKLSHHEAGCGRSSTTRETAQRRTIDGESRTRCCLRDSSCNGRPRMAGRI